MLQIIHISALGDSVSTYVPLVLHIINIVTMISIVFMFTDLLQFLRVLAAEETARSACLGARHGVTAWFVLRAYYFSGMGLDTSSFTHWLTLVKIVECFLVLERNSLIFDQSHCVKIFILQSILVLRQRRIMIWVN